MKTVELKWIEDDNHTVAKDACDTLQGLVDGGAFPDLGVKCEDDTLYITGEKEVLDRAVMKIQKAFAKYGQIMMKEAKNGTTEELRIESFDDNVQDIFNHTLAEYESFKENTKNERPNTYITTLGKFQYKFNKLKEAAAKKDKKILQNILMEIDELTESYEEIKFKPMNKLDEMDNLKNESLEENKRNLSKEVFGKKFLELAQTYAGVEDLDIEVAYDKLMSDNRVFGLVDSTMSIEDIMDKISAGELLQ
jgi:hypothetical protein